MGQKAILELLVGRLVGELRQRFHQLFLSIIDVLKLMDEEVVHGFDVAGKQSHRSDPSCFKVNPTARPSSSTHADMFDCRCCANGPAKPTFLPGANLMFGNIRES